MSLISVKNFVSPFTNTVHLVTIILVTILFAVFRLQGGGVKVSFSDSAEPVIESRTVGGANSLDTLIESEPPAQPVAKRPARTIPDSGSIQITSEEDDLIKQMIGRNPAPAREVTRKPAARDSDSLGEIEKSLGMR